MARKRVRRSRTTLDKVLSFFDKVDGQSNDRFDTAYSDRDRDRSKALSVHKHKEQFRKCVEFDFEYLLGRKFAAPTGTMQYVLPQSVLGRAQNGHGWFIDDDGIPLKFTDATFDNICTVLEDQYPQLSNIKVRTWRNHQIDRLNSHILLNIEEDSMMLEDDEGPLFGTSFLTGRQVNTQNLLKGMILAGHMDTFIFRRKMLGQYPNTFNGTPLQMGGGQIYVVHRDNFRKMALGNTGKRVFRNKQITELTNLNVIDNEKVEYSYPIYDQAYFRLREGDGISDDLAMLYIGKIYGLDAMMGAFLMDAVDTYDKYLMQFYPGGMDGRLTDRIVSATANLFDQPLITDNEAYKMIHFAAKENTPSIMLSSSHRRFIQYEDGSNKPTLLHHWAFLQGEKLNNIKLGFNRTPSHKFYKMVTKRFQSIDVNLPICNTTVT